MFDAIKYKIKSDRRISQNSTTYGGIITRAFGVICDHSICSQNFKKIFIKPRRGGYQIAAPGNCVRRPSVRPSVCPKRIGSKTTTAVGLNLIFYESP